MKIEKINVYAFELPTADPEGFAYGKGRYTKCDTVLVEIIASNGLVGWGEHTAILGDYAEESWTTNIGAIEYMAPSLIGEDPCNISKINTLMNQELRGNQGAKAAIDIACWDLLGKHLGKPVYALLGGKQTECAPMYDCLLHFPTEQETIDQFTSVREKGYKMFQIKVGDSVDASVERVTTIMEHINQKNEQVFVDANRCWTKKQALQFLSRTTEYDFVFEQPCDSYEDCLDVKSKTTKPMKLDEVLSEKGNLIRALRDKAMEVACLKISYFGGISGARIARDMCIANGVMCHIEDTWGTEVVTSAYAHLAVNTPEKWLYTSTDLHHFNSLHIAQEGTGPITDKGTIKPSDKPGIGVEVDRSKIGVPVRTFS